MARKQKANHPNFKKYQDSIVEHPNFRTLPNMRNAQGDITWVKVGDKGRTKWWDDLKAKLGLRDRAAVAREIHPREMNGYKPCQICGRSMSIYYIYPQANAIEKLNLALAPLSFTHFLEDVYQVTSDAFDEYSQDGLDKVADVFNIQGDFKDSENLAEEIVKAGRFLSPGAMSNAPDRLDGFHTYNACCRGEQDSGRAKGNLARYSIDRRAFENWSVGDWRGADRLMGIYKKNETLVACPKCKKMRKMTADHIGPISLGFAHRMDFQPLCISCNSGKNNRLTFADVRKLIESESKGVEVVSWHAKFIWDLLKGEITDDESASNASVLMRRNMHFVLIVLAEIYSEGYEEYLLQFLNPNFAHFEHEFSNFDPSTGGFTSTSRPIRSLNTEKLAQRYLRISFDALVEYASKQNRKNGRWSDAEADQRLDEVLSSLESADEISARAALDSLLARLATIALADFQGF